MQDDAMEVNVKGVMPTSNGCAVFLGCEEKTFVIYPRGLIPRLGRFALQPAQYRGRF